MDSRPSPSDAELELLQAAVQRRPRILGCMGSGGCVLGCLGFTLLALIVSSLGVAWLVRSAPLPPANVLIGDDAAWVQVVHLDDEDPGVRALTHLVVTRLREGERRTSEGDTVERFLRGLLVGLTEAVLPVQVARVGDQAGSTLVVSVGGTTGVARVAFWKLTATARQQGMPVTRDRGVEVFTVKEPSGPPDRAFVASSENSFVISARETPVRDTVLRLQRGQVGRSKLMELLGLLDARQDAVGAMSNEHGEIAAFLKEVATAQKSATSALPPLTPEQIEAADIGIAGVAWEVDVLGEDELDARLYLVARTEAFAAEARGVLERAAAALERAGKAKSHGVTVKGKVVRLEVRVTRVREMVERALKRVGP